MDVERLKKGTMFTDEHFDRQLENIREIRLSERKFYQKVTDLYATAFDYDKDAKIRRKLTDSIQKWIIKAEIKGRDDLPLFIHIFCKMQYSI